MVTGIDLLRSNPGIRREKLAFRQKDIELRARAGMQDHAEDPYTSRRRQGALLLSPASGPESA